MLVAHNTNLLKNPTRHEPYDMEYLGRLPTSSFDLVAKWLHAEFGAYYGESLEQRRDKLKARCHERGLCSTVVALKSEQGCEVSKETGNKILIGTATLLDTDMPTHPQWSVHTACGLTLPC